MIDGYGPPTFYRFPQVDGLVATTRRMRRRLNPTLHVETIICSPTAESDVADDVDADVDAAPISDDLEPVEVETMDDDELATLTLSDFDEEECEIAARAIAPSVPPPTTPEGRPLLKRIGRGYQRRACVAHMNHGLRSTDRFFEPRLASSLYAKIPMPCEATPSSPARFTAAMSLADDYESRDVRIGNWSQQMRVLADDRRARCADEDARREMRAAMARIADEPAPPAKTVLGPLARKRPIVGALKTYRCRAYPTRDQARVLKKFARAETLDAYNAAVRLMNDAKTAKAKQPRETELKTVVRPQFDSAEVPSYMVDSGVRRAVAARGTSERKRELAIAEGRRAMKYTLHERTETGTTTLRCTFTAATKGIKHVSRANDASKTCLLNFDVRAARTSAIRQLGTIKVKERAHGDLETKIRFGVHNSRAQLVQKEDVTFEFDKRRNRWYACFVYDDDETSARRNSRSNGDVAVLDLGLNPPATVFSPTTHAVYNPFPNDFDAMRLAKWRAIEKLQSAVSKRNWARARSKVGTATFTRTPNKYRRTTQRMKATLARKHLNFVEWVRNVHQSVANHLVREFDYVGCPPLDTKFFSRHVNDSTKQKKIKRRCRRKTQGQALSKFTKILQNAAFRDGKTIVTERAIESGTSGTCGDCGTWHADLGFAKTYVCPSCELKIDRDVNGARNNALQLLADGGFGRGL